MEKWYKQHQGLIFYIGVSASILTYAVSATVFAYTNFSTKEEVLEIKKDIKEDIREIKQDVKVLLQRGNK
jgi:hypothetical protein